MELSRVEYTYSWIISFFLFETTHHKYYIAFRHLECQSLERTRSPLYTHTIALSLDIPKINLFIYDKECLKFELAWMKQIIRIEWILYLLFWHDNFCFEIREVNIRHVRLTSFQNLLHGISNCEFYLSKKQKEWRFNNRNFSFLFIIIGYCTNNADDKEI